MIFFLNFCSHHKLENNILYLLSEKEIGGISLEDYFLECLYTKKDGE